MPSPRSNLFLGGRLARWTRRGFEFLSAHGIGRDGDAGMMNEDEKASRAAAHASATTGRPAYLARARLEPAVGRSKRQSCEERLRHLADWTLRARQHARRYNSFAGGCCRDHHPTVPLAGRKPPFYYLYTICPFRGRYAGGRQRKMILERQIVTTAFKEVGRSRVGLLTSSSTVTTCSVAPATLTFPGGIKTWATFF